MVLFPIGIWPSVSYILMEAWSAEVEARVKLERQQLAVLD